MPRYIRNIAALILFFAIPSLPEVLMLHINEEKPGSAFCLKCNHEIESECVPVEDGRCECYPGETTIKKIVLKNPRIELEKVIQNLDEYIPENLRRRVVLERKMNSNFLKDFNKMVLLVGHIIVGFCYNVNIYDNEKLIATFETNGDWFYDRENKLMYQLYKKDSIYKSEENFLRKYWDIYEENRCR